MTRASIATILVAAFTAVSAEATPLVISNVGGLPGNGWFNIVGDVDVVQNQAGQLTDSILWGGTSPASGYQFTPVNPSIPLVLGAPFLLGDFAHLNNPVNTSISSAQYSFGFSTNGTPGAFNTVFDFTHDETYNFDPCPANPVTGAASVSTCDDFVTVGSLLLNGMIMAGSDRYYFNLLGFSQDGGSNFTRIFQTQEGQANHAGLYGIVTTQPFNVPVPEPASFILLGAGLSISALRDRMRRTRSSRNAIVSRAPRSHPASGVS